MPSTKNNNQEVDAYSDSGSTISLASCGSGESGFAPKPPLDGFTRSKSVKGRRSKVTQSPSPYASRQVTAKRREAVNTSTRNLWLTSMKNGHGALSTNNTAMNTWAGQGPVHAKKRRPGSRTRNFSDVVEFSNPKTKSHSRSATLSNTEPQIGGGGGGPALKPAEDYYDEVIELKKIINSLKEDNNLLSTKLHRVEEENMIKDRKMDDLLNARKQPEDFRRTLTDKRGDTSSIVNSLKQKLHGVERTVKDKEAELSKLRRELKMTDIEELRIQSETYYQEVQRLQLAILQMQQERINYTSSLTDLNKSDVMASARGKRPMSASQHRLLTEDVEMLQAENKSLKKELISAVENQSKKSNKKSLNVDYADMSRAQLLHTILDLEMRLDEPRERTKDSMTEKEEKVERKGSKKRKSQESEEKLSHLEDTEGELKEERDKLRQTIERLKEDRTHYRNVADDLRKQLKAKEEEVEKLHHRLSQTTAAATVTAGGGTGGAASGSVTKRKSSTASTASQSSSKGQSITARERDQQIEKEFEEFKTRHAAKVLQKQWRSYQGQKQEQLTKEEEKLKQEKAAKTLQREWKKHLKQKERASQDEAITDIQATFRGHLARKDRLDRFHSDSVDSDDAIICVQSAMRGHLTRSTNRGNPEEDWSGDKSSIRAGRELLDDDEEEEEEEDDIVMSRSTSHDKSPFSSKKHSRFTASTASPSLSPTHPTPRTRSSPHPAPRSLITLNTTPPSPAPRHRERRQEVKPPETLLDSSDDSDDDNVVIGGSSRAKQTKQTNKQQPQPENKPESKGETTESSSSALMDVDLPRGLTKNINPQRTIVEVSEESDNQLVTSAHRSQKKRNSPQTPSWSSISSDMRRERNRHEIIDSSDDDDVDEDDDDDLVMTHAKERTSSSSTSRKSSHDKSARRNTPIRNQMSGKTRKTSSKELHDSNEESDDDAVVVTSRKRTESKQKETSNPRSSFSKTSLSKKESLGDSLHNPKRTLRTSEDVRTTGRSLVNDDDDDDDDIVIGSWRKKQAKGDSSLKNDSLSSLWSDSSKQKKKSSSGFGFGSFEKVSSFRKHNSGLDELF